MPAAADRASVAELRGRAGQAGQISAGAADRATTAGAVWSWIVGILMVVGAASLLQFDPPRAVRLPWSDTPLPELCGSQRLLGVDCAGCGLTRSFILSAHGRWREAWAMHAAGTVAFLFLLALLPYRLWQGWQLARGHRPRSTVSAEMFFWVAVVAMQLLWWMASTAARHASALSLLPP